MQSKVEKIGIQSSTHSPKYFKPKLQKYKANITSVRNAQQRRHLPMPTRVPHEKSPDAHNYLIKGNLFSWLLKKVNFHVCVALGERCRYIYIYIHTCIISFTWWAHSVIIRRRAATFQWRHELEHPPPRRLFKTHKKV